METGFACSIHRAESRNIIRCKNGRWRIFHTLQQTFGEVVSGLLLVIAFEDQLLPDWNIVVSQGCFVATQPVRCTADRE